MQSNAIKPPILTDIDLEALAIMLGEDWQAAAFIDLEDAPPWDGAAMLEMLEATGTLTPWAIKKPAPPCRKAKPRSAEG